MDAEQKREIIRILLFAAVFTIGTYKVLQTLDKKLSNTYHVARRVK